jgi:hypothetical protein
VFIEAYLVDTWAEHLRQHERITVADKSIEDKALSFHIGDKPPVVSHFIAEELTHEDGDNGGEGQLG